MIKKQTQREQGLFVIVQQARLTYSFVPSGLILAVDCHTQKGMGTRRMLIHVSDGGSPVRLSDGKHLSINQSIH